LPIERHAVSPLLLGAWTLRNELRLVDGLYVELARQLGLRLITTDQRLARSTPMVERSARHRRYCGAP
jgi:predicted nucleic acid-binding protein